MMDLRFRWVPGFFFLSVMFVGNAMGVTLIDQSTYDAHTPGYISLGKNGEMYVLTGDIVAEDTAFIVQGHGIKLDLNGFTVVYGNGNVVTVPNDDFEVDEPGAAPSGWIVKGGSASVVKSDRFWSGDKQLHIESAAGSNISLESQTFPVNAGKTHVMYMMSDGPRDAEVILGLYDSADDSLIAERVQGPNEPNDNGSYMQGGVAHERSFKLDAPVTAYLKVTIRNSSVDDWSIYLDRITVKPARSYAVICASYANKLLHPDIPVAPANGGRSSDFTFEMFNGTITQGLAGGVYSPVIDVYSSAYLHDLKMNVRGDNTSVIYAANGNGVYERLKIIHDSDFGVLCFNRFAGQSIMTFAESSRAITVRNCSLYGGGWQGISLYRRASADYALHPVLIERNTIENFQRVTNGYAIGCTQLRNFKIKDNIIEPVWGRGILLDNVGGDGSLPTTNEGEIVGNMISVKERRNAEFGNDMLQSPGIRIRDYRKGGNIVHIHDNFINAVCDETTVNEANGIVVTARHRDSDVLIENNNIWAVSSDPQKNAHAIIFEGCNELNHDVYRGTVPVILRGNTFTSNTVCVQFGGLDGSNTWNVDLFDNTYKAPPDLLGHEFHTRSIGHAGQVTGGFHSGKGHFDVEGDVTFNDEVYGAGTSERDTRHGGYDPGSYEYFTNRSITVKVVDENGDSVAGAKVTVEDVFGTKTTNLSDAQGVVKVFATAYLTKGVGTDYTETDFYPYTISVASVGLSQKTTIDILDTKKIVTINVATGGVEITGQARD